MTMIDNININILLIFSQLKLNDSGPDFSSLSDTVVKWLNAFLIPVFIIIGGLSVYKLVSLGWKIAHSSDQPDERKTAIQGVCWWAVGLILCIASPVLVNLLLPALINASGGGFKPPKT